MTTTKPTGACPACDRGAIGLTKAGTIRWHTRYITGLGHGLAKEVCPGYGQPPKEQ